LDYHWLKLLDLLGLSGMGGHSIGDHLWRDHLQGRSGSHHADPLLSRGAPGDFPAKLGMLDIGNLEKVLYPLVISHSRGK